jgi:hypothetical protein
MRSALIFLVLASAPAFCQETPPAPGNAGQIMNDNLQRRLQDILSHSQFATPGKVVFKLTNSVSSNVPMSVCSIPLLNVKPAGNPVPMPTVRLPQAGAQSQGPIDHMNIVAPAPACAPNFNGLAAPATAP